MEYGDANLLLHSVLSALIITDGEEENEIKVDKINEEDPSLTQTLKELNTNPDPKTANNPMEELTIIKVYWLGINIRTLTLLSVKLAQLRFSFLIIFGGQVTKFGIFWSYFQVQFSHL